MATQPVSAALRKRVLKVVTISLLLDLISFTFILPLFPRLLDFYLHLDTTSPTPTPLRSILTTLNTYKHFFAKPIDSRYDVVLLGGSLGSLFSLLQAIAAPVIGRIADTYGRRPALLLSMGGNTVSVLLWVLAGSSFNMFLLSRIVGGLSEGNVQLAIAMATDVSGAENRSSTMAIVGGCFSVAFTFGPLLGAWLSGLEVVRGNPFGVAAGVSLALIVTETVYLYFFLPETLPSIVNPKSVEEKIAEMNEAELVAKKAARTNSHTSLNLTHFAFILLFSGIEFSLPFMTYSLFSYTPMHNGRVLGFIGLVASVLQGGVTRRLSSLTNVRMGVISCLVAMYILSWPAAVLSQRWLYVAASLLAVTSATVVTGLNALSSFEAGVNERGRKLGGLRSAGQVGRAIGPVTFCTLYWWVGRQTAYNLGLAGMLLVVGWVVLGLRDPEKKTKSQSVSTPAAEMKKDL